MPWFSSDGFISVEWDLKQTRTAVNETLCSEFAGKDYVKQILPVAAATPVTKMNYPFPSALSGEWMTLVKADRMKVIFTKAQIDAKMNDEKWNLYMKRPGVYRRVLYDGLDANERAEVKAKLKQNKEWEKDHGFVWFNHKQTPFKPAPVPSGNPDEDEPAQKSWAAYYNAECTLNATLRYEQLKSMGRTNQYPMRSYIHQA